MTDARALTCDEVRDLAPLFVTGALEAGEAAAIRAHLATCAEAHPELLELGEAATALLESVEPVEPPARLRSRLLAAAAADLETGRHPATAGLVASAAAASAPDVVVAAHPAVAPESVVAPDPAVAPESVVAPGPVPAAAPVSRGTVIDLDAARARRRPRLAWLLAAAAVIAVVVLGGLDIGLRRDLDAAQAYRDGVTAALELAAQPGSTTALLASGDGRVSGIGVVGADGGVRLAMTGLAPTSGTQVYTAWAIEGDAAPVPIGEFTVGADGHAVAVAAGSPTGAGAVLALTLEPARGATTPTLPIVAAGTTTAPAG